MNNTLVIPGKKDAYYFHRVLPNDTLSQLIADYYGVGWSGAQPHLQTVMQDNPEITDPDRIKPGQLIMLRESLMGGMCEAINLAESQQFKARWQSMDHYAQQAVINTSPWYPMISASTASAGSTLFALEKTLRSNLPLLNEIPQKYEAYKAGKISKGQYDYFRQRQLKQYTRNIGPMIKQSVYGTQTPRQVMRIDRSKPIPRSTLSMQQHMDKLSRTAKIASRGSIVLVGVGLAASCSQIANTKGRLEKNEIAVETIASTAAGAIGGVAAGVFLVSNPVGWGIVLVVGAATAIASIGAGHAMGEIYKSTDLKKIDLVSGLGIDKVCK